MTQHEKLFESLPPTRLFFRCALPSMISMAMLSLYTVADGIFVGRYVGPNALAAVNLVMPLIMMSFALVDLVAVGSSVQISIRLGEKDVYKRQVLGRLGGRGGGSGHQGQAQGHPRRQPAHGFLAHKNHLPSSVLLIYRRKEAIPDKEIKIFLKNF